MALVRRLMFRGNTNLDVACICTISMAPAITHLLTASETSLPLADSTRADPKDFMCGSTVSRTLVVSYKIYISCTNTISHLCHYFFSCTSPMGYLLTSMIAGNVVKPNTEYRHVRIEHFLHLICAIETAMTVKKYNVFYVSDITELSLPLLSNPN